MEEQHVDAADLSRIAHLLITCRSDERGDHGTLWLLRRSLSSGMEQRTHLWEDDAGSVVASAMLVGTHLEFYVHPDAQGSDIETRAMAWPGECVREPSWLPQLVGERDLLAANALGSISGNVGRVVGPALGGALLALLGLPAVAAVDGASFLLTAAIMLPIVAPPRSSHDVTDTAPGWRSAVGTFWHAWANGLRIVQRETAVSAIVATMGVASCANGGLSALLAPFLQGVLRLGGDAVRVDDGLAASGIGWLAIIHAGATPVLLPLFVLVGIPSIAWQVVLSAHLQGTVDNRYLGRVWGSYGTLIALVAVGATALASVTATVVGIQRTLDMASVLYLSARILAAALLSHARRPSSPLAADR